MGRVTLQFFCIHRHCSTGFASCRTCQCVKICLERTTSKCSHISCLECTCMSCRNCLRCSHAIWPLPGWRGWQVAAMQQTAIHVFSQQASFVLGPSCATFAAFSSQYRWVGGRRATTECSYTYVMTWETWDSEVGSVAMRSFIYACRCLCGALVPFHVPKMSHWIELTFDWFPQRVLFGIDLTHGHMILMVSRQ